MAHKYKKYFMTDTLNNIFDKSVNDDLAMGLSSVVYIFHKGVFSNVLCSFEAQMNMYIFPFEVRSTFNTVLFTVRISQFNL